MKTSEGLRFLLTLLLCAPLLGCVTACADDTFPITLEGKFTENTFGKRIERSVTVTGKTRFPEGTNLTVGLRQLGEGLFVAWYDCIVREKAFLCTIGPFFKPVAYGKYVVEARFAPDRQIQGLVKQVQEAAKKDAGIASALKPDGTACGSCVVMVGTPEQLKADQEELIKLYTEVHGQLQKVYDPIAEHLQKSDGKIGGDTAWIARIGELLKSMHEIDDKVVRDHHGRVTMCYPRAYTSAAETIIDLGAILGGDPGAGAKLAAGGNNMALLKKAADALAGVLENLQPSTESEENLPGHGKK